MTYSVKEMYYTLQGEGAMAGRAAVFCRFSGCNLWSGHEIDRDTATCRFCDTDFIGTDGPGGGKFKSADALADAVQTVWPAHKDSRTIPFVVCTGGEPLLQLDRRAVEAFHERGMQVAVETNGTRTPPEGIDWLCVSPKVGAELVVLAGSELKLVYPQVGGDPEQFEDLSFAYFYLQPMDGPNAVENTSATISYCLAHPRWRLSLQNHKLIGLP